MRTWGEWYSLFGGNLGSYAEHTQVARVTFSSRGTKKDKKLYKDAGHVGVEAPHKVAGTTRVSSVNATL